jgi:hypothetical protein
MATVGRHRHSEAFPGSCRSAGSHCSPLARRAYRQRFTELCDLTVCPIDHSPNQISVYSEISNASSTSMPRYLTVDSSLCTEVHRLDYLPRRTMSRRAPDHEWAARRIAGHSRLHYKPLRNASSRSSGRPAFRRCPSCRGAPTLSPGPAKEDCSVQRNLCVPAVDQSAAQVRDIVRRGR